jgi:hypothetical protein
VPSLPQALWWTRVFDDDPPIALSSIDPATTTLAAAAAAERLPCAVPPLPAEGVPPLAELAPDAPPPSPALSSHCVEVRRPRAPPPRRAPRTAPAARARRARRSARHGATWQVLYAYAVAFRVHGGRLGAAPREAAATLLTLSGVLRLRAGEGAELGALGAALAGARARLSAALPFLASQIQPLHLQARSRRPRRRARPAVPSVREPPPRLIPQCGT